MSRRKCIPSGVTISFKSETRTDACTMRLPRSFAMRNMSVGLPSRCAMTTFLLKRTRAVGRENFAKRSPVVSAVKSMPVNASNVTTRCAMRETGDIFP